MFHVKNGKRGKMGRGIFFQKISRVPISNSEIGKLAQQGAEKIAA